jgi:CPA2 family monovalent cation:H+ antiporter-2
VLARLAEKHGILDADAIAPLLAAGIASMFLTPLLARMAPHITAGERIIAPLERLIGVRSIDEVDDKAPGFTNHVVIVGYGLAGQLTARTLAACQIPYVVLELGAERVREAKAQGLPVYYGDATSQEALGHAHLDAARALVLLMNDPHAANRVVDTARRVAPHVPVLMRTRYLASRPALMQIGARDVVAEEVEGAVEVIARVLRWSEVPRNVIDQRIAQARAETQASDRKQTVPRTPLSAHRALAELKIESVLIQENSTGAGQSVAALELRSTTGALVVAVRRGERLLERPDPAIPFEAGDVVYLVGTGGAIAAAIALLAEPV